MTTTESHKSSDDEEEDPSRIEIGELHILSQDFEDTEHFSFQAGTPANSQSRSVNVTSVDVEAVYGIRLTEEEAVAAVPAGDEGLVRYSLVLPDNFCSHKKLIGGLNNRDFDVETGSIKPRRASLPMTQTQLFTSLTKVDGPEGPRWIFNGVLNGWPSLKNFELIELEKKRSLGPLTVPDYLNRIKHTWAKYWDVEKEGKAGISPAIKETGKIYRARLRGPPWSSKGWCSESPGFVFWFEAQRPVPRVIYGTRAIKEVGEDRCSMVG